MSKTTKIVLVSFFSILVTFAFSQNIYAVSLNVTVATSQESYDLGENIVVFGKLTLNSTPVSDGLVAIQVNDPKNDLFVTRTRPTGTTITGPFSVEILEVTPCDSGGNPKYSFRRGGEAGFKVTIKNNEVTPHNATITLNTYYTDGTSFAALVLWKGEIGASQTKTISAWPILIPVDALTGTATVYANLFTKLPEDGGWAYCPEQSETFTITSSTTMATSTAEATSSPSEEGAYDTTFRIWGYGGMLGNYTVYASTLYEIWRVTNSTTFEAILLGDIAGGAPNGIVNILDVATVAAAFGSYPSHERWNPDADLNKDGFVNILDVSTVSSNFGKWGILDP